MTHDKELSTVVLDCPVKWLIMRPSGSLETTHRAFSTTVQSVQI